MPFVFCHNNCIGGVHGVSRLNLLFWCYSVIYHFALKYVYSEIFSIIFLDFLFLQMAYQCVVVKKNIIIEKIILNFIFTVNLINN